MRDGGVVSRRDRLLEMQTHRLALCDGAEAVAVAVAAAEHKLLARAPRLVKVELLEACAARPGLWWLAANVCAATAQALTTKRLHNISCTHEICETHVFHIFLA